MTVGYPVDKGQVDMISGQLSRQIESWAPDILKFQAWLDTLSVDDLKLLPFGYTEDEAVLLKSAVTEMGHLAQVYLGKEELTPARDLSTFPRRLAGLYL